MTLTEICNSEKYLSRIGLSTNLPINDDTLRLIHRHHILNVPFENLDIHYRKPFTLDPNAIFEKVVLKRRGGFCYELNLLFCWLLNELGFSVKTISARIVNDDESLGPSLDHMCLHVRTDKHYLADVGYGDLFTTPIEMKPEVQTDGRNYFRIEHHNEGFCLQKSQDGHCFQKKYVFGLEEVPPKAFDTICREKQTHPDSYFVKNTICTRATETGRLTIFNNKLIERTLTGKVETPILSDNDLQIFLKNHFDITQTGPMQR